MESLIVTKLLKDKGGVIKLKNKEGK